MKSINPYTGQLIKAHTELSEKEIEQKIKISYDHFLTYRETGFGNRREHMTRVSEILKARADEYGKIISLEMGKPISEAIAEVKKCAWVCEYYAENAESFLEDKIIKTDAGSSFVAYQPLGPVLAVMPWNFPFWQVFRASAPALMAGNTLLLKHASNVQLCAEAIEKTYIDAGFDPAAFQNLAISSSKVKILIDDPRVKAATLTGSEEAGASVAVLAGRNIKKTVLELGGNNAFVVLKDADLDLAVKTAVVARLQNGGQSCIAAKRFILETDIHDIFLKKLLKELDGYTVGDPLDPSTRLGPLSSPQQAESVKIQVEKSVKAGAVKLFAGRQSGTIYDPVILTGVKPGMPAFDEELFGPVFAVTEAGSSEQALEMANRSTFGLGINVFTSSREKADDFIRHADEGAVFVNAMVKSDPRLPFGGVKRSGFGRELSVEGIREFVNIKTVYINEL